jgi:protoporphyrinogen oxidase
MQRKTAVIIGAGPAGITAAHELVNKTDIRPVILEMTGQIGGISKTVNYKGNRIDIGGHRFFSKHDKIMEWWLSILPLQGSPSIDDTILNRKIELSNESDAPDPEKSDRVMLIRNRVSRIFFLRKFFDYPISLNYQTITNLGFILLSKASLSYARARLFPIKEEKSLEDFFINRFGVTLYEIFFKDYTEKLWGVPCSVIRPEWGAQRVKGLSLTGAIINAFRKIFSRSTSYAQKEIETSLIERFFYPKYGPGQMWEEVARRIEAKGGDVRFNSKVIGIETKDDRVVAVKIRNEGSGEIERLDADYVFSSMPVKDLVISLGPEVPPDVRKTAEGLLYRDFITVGLLLKKLKIANDTKVRTINSIVPDNWIYIQERDVRLGRIQIFNNWSPYLVKDKDTVWIGLEYFCFEGDNFWNMPDAGIAKMAIDEVEKINIIDREDVIDSTVIRMPKAYPAYFGSYDRFDVIKRYTDSFENLFLIGRNGMHRYNNQDHSMMTAMQAVENIINGVKGKENIWSVNTEDEYHEVK